MDQEQLRLRLKLAKAKAAAAMVPHGSPLNNPDDADKAQRVLAYLKATPERVADTLTSSDTIPSAASGATFGGFPSLSAAVDTVPAVLRKAAGGGGDIGQEYDRNIRRLKPLYEGAVERQPAANLAGMAVSPNPLGKAGAVGRVVGAAGQGALADYFAGNPGDGASAAASGNTAPVAAGIQAALEMAPTALRGAAQGLGKAGDLMAVKAAGSRAGITDALKKMGYRPEDLPELGRSFMREKLIPTGLNPLKEPLEQTVERAAALQSKSGAAVGDILDKAEEVQRFDFPRAAAETRVPPRTAAEADASGRMEGLVDQVGRQEAITPGVRVDPGAPAGQNSFRGANALKSDAYRSVDWKAEAPLAAEIHRKGTSNLRGAIERQVGENLGPDEMARLKASNRSWGTAADADALATNAISRGEQKQPFGVARGIVSALGGAGVGNALGGLEGAGAGMAAATVINNALLKRGPNLAAHGYSIAAPVAGALGSVAEQIPKSGGASTALADYLRPLDEDELERKSVAAFTGQTR